MRATLLEVVPTVPIRRAAIRRRLRLARSSVACLVTSLLCFAVACGDDNKAPTPTVYRSTITVDYEEKLRVIPPLLFGQNLQPTERGEQVVAADGSLDSEIVGILAQARVTSLRFPGGTPADQFTWWQSTGPPSRRALQAGANENEFYRPVIGVEEFVDLAQALRAIPFVTANTGNGTPELAASWAAYFNSVGFPISFWEIGNEPYFAGIDDTGKLGLTPEAYGERLIQYAGAIKAVAPEAKIFAAGIASSDLGNSFWNTVLLGVAGAHIDGLSLHNAYAPIWAYTPGDNPTIPSEDYIYAAMMGASQAVENSLDRLVDDLAQRGHMLPLYITEYDGVFFPDEEAGVEDVETTLARNPTLACAIYNASIFQVMMRNNRVHGAHHMSLAGENYGSLVGIDGKTRYRNPQFYVHQEYALESDNITVAIEVDPRNAHFDSGPVREIPGQTDVPMLDAVATTTPLGDGYSLFVVNRSLHKDVETRVETNMPAGLEATVQILNGPTYDARNDALDTLRVSLKPIDPPASDASFSWRFPAHSLTIMRWKTPSP